MRVCIKCGIEKQLEAFSIHKTSRDGYTNECRDCASRRKYEWLVANREKARQNTIKWRRANIEKARAASRLNAKRWSASNPEKVREYSIGRRARKKANTYYQVSAKYLKRIHSSSCIYCGSNEFIEADHVIPLARGGQHSIGNLAPACRTCNASKRDRFIMEWRVRK
jgi:5-methylcytosine-specific restriction endonuclease McrA